MISVKIPKQSQYPKYIYFGIERYKIVFRKNLNCYGITDPNKHVIEIKDGLSPRNLLTTFIHEVLHVFYFEANIKALKKHKAVYAVEKALLEFLLDNILASKK